MQELNRILSKTKSRVSREDLAEFSFVLLAWKKLSSEKDFPKELSFEEFYSQKIEFSKLKSIFKQLAKNYELFSMYLLDNFRLKDEELENLMVNLENLREKPSIYDLPFVGLRFQTSNEVHELSMKLLDKNINEIYAPFSADYKFISHTDKKIFAENNFVNSALMYELINILEDKNISFHLSEPIKEPFFTNQQAPHLLKEFDGVYLPSPINLTIRENIPKDKYNRFWRSNGKSYELMMIEHAISQTKKRSIIQLPTGFCFKNASGYSEIRRYLTDGKNILEGVIQLPSNIHHNTQISTVLLVINKEKKDQNVFFLNLANERFLQKSGRNTVLNGIDEIVNIFENKKEIENISAIVSNEEITKNSWVYSIDRYVISKEAQSLNAKLNRYKLTSLEDIAEIKRSQMIKDEEEGKEVFEISPSDFPLCDFAKIHDKLKTKRIKTQEKRVDTYKLEPFDILISTKGSVGKVAIIGELNETLLASQASDVIRLKDKTKENATSLYMYLKSNMGKISLDMIISGAVMPQITTIDLKKLKVPIFSKNEQKKLCLNFKEEIKLYNDINKLKSKIEALHVELGE